MGHAHDLQLLLLVDQVQLQVFDELRVLTFDLPGADVDDERQFDGRLVDEGEVGCPCDAVDDQHAHVERFMGEDDAGLDDVDDVLQHLLLPASGSDGDGAVELPGRLAHEPQLQLLHLLGAELQLFVDDDALALDVEDDGRLGDVLDLEELFELVAEAEDGRLVEDVALDVELGLNQGEVAGYGDLVAVQHLHQDPLRVVVLVLLGSWSRHD